MPRDTDDPTGAEGDLVAPVIPLRHHAHEQHDPDCPAYRPEPLQPTDTPEHQTFANESPWGSPSGRPRQRATPPTVTAPAGHASASGRRPPARVLAAAGAGAILAVVLVLALGSGHHPPVPPANGAEGPAPATSPSNALGRLPRTIPSPKKYAADQVAHSQRHNASQPRRLLQAPSPPAEAVRAPPPATSAQPSPAAGAQTELGFER
jgi:hypothetical protein